MCSNPQHDVYNQNERYLTTYLLKYFQWQQILSLLDLAAADSTKDIGRVLFWYGLDFSARCKITFSAVSKTVNLKITITLNI